MVQNGLSYFFYNVIEDEEFLCNILKNDEFFK